MWLALVKRGRYPRIEDNHDGERDTHVGMNVVLQQAEAAKTSLREVFSQVKRLIGSLKRHRHPIPHVPP